MRLLAPATSMCLLVSSLSSHQRKKLLVKVRLVKLHLVNVGPDTPLVMAGTL